LWPAETKACRRDLAAAGKKGPPMKAIVAAALSLTLAGGIAAAQPQPMSIEQAVSRMWGYSLQVRAGRYDLAEPALVLARETVAAYPNDARAWSGLGNAAGQMASSLSRPGANPMLAFAALDESMRAFTKAVELDPTDAESLSALGGNQAIFGLIRANPALTEEGIRNMERASVIAPENPVVRLRVFTGVNLPPALRNVARDEDDLKFLVRATDGTRRGDHIRLLLGDVYAEAGRSAEAKVQYEAALRPGTAVETLARARLASLAGGGVPAGEITALRGRLASDCAMCHSG
jgi:tetratricopeptide (TPR) repeat protein